MKKLWAWAVAVVAFAFWHSADRYPPPDDDALTERFRRSEGW